MTVINGDTDTPGSLVSIPGWVKGNESGYRVSKYNGLTNYTTSGPAVWANQGTGSSIAAPQTAAIQVLLQRQLRRQWAMLSRNMGNAAVRIMWDQQTVWQERHAKRVGGIFTVCMMACRSSLRIVWLWDCIAGVLCQDSFHFGPQILVKNSKS